MDNFMDKLAEKYNAQDMIRANSQAETAQMQSLQDQVEAYEAVLQEMRKLNYKNTELTEKMYALVDESIEKVRTLQIEAAAGDVSTAEVSREMSDAVNRAVSEAMSSMDETMARTLGEKLQLPADELRQSNAQMEEMAAALRQSNAQMEEAAAALRQSSAQMDQTAADLRDSMDTLQNAADAMKENMADANAGLRKELAEIKEAVSGSHADDIMAAADLIIDSLESHKTGQAGLREDADRIISTLESHKTEQAGLREDVRQQGELAEEIRRKLEELLELSAQNAQAAELQRSVTFEAEAQKLPEVTTQEVLDVVRAAETAQRERNEDILDELHTSDNAIQDRLFAIQQSNTNTEESLSAVAAAVASLREDGRREEDTREILEGLRALTEQVSSLKDESLHTEAPQELVEGLRALTEQVSSLKDESLHTEAPQELVEGLRALTEQVSSLKDESLHTEAPAEVMACLQALSARVNEIYEKQQLPDAQGAETSEKVTALAEVLQQQSRMDELTKETLMALTQSNTQTQDSLTELRAAVENQNAKAAQEEAVRAVLEKLTELQQENKETKEAVLSAHKAGEARNVGIGELKTIGDDTKAALLDIYDSLEKAKGGIRDIKAQQLQPQIFPAEEELRQMLTELLSGHSELMTNVRTLKGAADDTKSTIKSAVDNAVYGIKQDNKELVTILQRMNATLTSRNDEQERAQKEEEAQAKAEEARRQLEERFKLTEDFMHKESVKVYRNVQAVINEKNDKQVENMESGNQALSSSLTKVKVWAIISTIVGGANLVLMILKIFGILN